MSQPSIESIEPSHFEGSIKYTSKTIKETLLNFICNRILGSTKIYISCFEKLQSRLVPQIIQLKTLHWTLYTVIPYEKNKHLSHLLFKVFRHKKNRLYCKMGSRDKFFETNCSSIRPRPLSKIIFYLWEGVPFYVWTTCPLLTVHSFSLPAYIYIPARSCWLKTTRLWSEICCLNEVLRDTV